MSRGLGDVYKRQLRISKRTLYEYFSSKQEIVEQAIISFFDPIYEYHQKLLDDKTMTCEEKIIAFFEIPNKNWKVLSVRNICELLEKMPDVYERLESRYQKDWSLLEQILDEAQQTGEFKPFDKSCYCACCTAHPMTSSSTSTMSIKIPVLVPI